MPRASRATTKPATSARSAVTDPLRAHFAARGWVPYPFQADAWAAYARGESGLVSVPTGAGKTYAAYGGPLADLALRVAGDDGRRGLGILYVSPLRAVSRDIEKALREPIESLGLPLTVGSRTGDTSSAERARQKKRPPDVLVTTPESLSLLLTQSDARDAFAGTVAVIVDEWHEMMANKRGAQVELALVRLRRFAPGLRSWALSATLARPELAARQVVGVGRAATVLRTRLERPVIVESLIPARIERFPWSGHLGLAMLKPLLEWLDPNVSTLLFTNTRSQAERWFAEILKAKPEWAERLALHHGSIDRDVREKVEAGVKEGSLSLVVCTSSLDLGVDFSPVERVVQIGSPKGIARLLQRAGRSGHRPGATCRVLCVPTHAMELVEIAAARQAIERHEIEERPSLKSPLDCLVQHLVTCAMGGGFEADDLFDEVRTAVSFESLTRAEFDWCLDLVTRGGDALRAYPQFQRVSLVEGRYVTTNRRLEQIHRMNVGTIASDVTVTVRLLRGGTIGTIEEDFVARLRPGEPFLFAGRTLELVSLRDATAIVRPARKATVFTPHWGGSRFPLSTALAQATRRVLHDAAQGVFDEPEALAAAPILAVQNEISTLPTLDAILVETAPSEEGNHLFLYPFEGRLVHEGLAALLALRLGRIRRATFAISINDYGIELLTDSTFPFVEHMGPALFSSEALVDDLLESINLGELGLRQFREIARVSGLIIPRLPGAEKTSRQLQVGTTLLWEVLNEFDPRNLLVSQARREVLDRHFEESRLGRTLERLARGPLRIVRCETPGPLALPLVADRLGTSLSTETLFERLARLGVRHAGENA
ncbi:MAG: ligase-associated DNA damage response DEXH box helicase [Phycisphaerae bacterium]|nr:ligase-associated DNA damage response DEXH box helicase [Phycisphaerae bacterium]